MAGKNLECIIVEEWMEKRVTGKVPKNLTIKRKFQVLVSLNERDGEIRFEIGTISI